MQQGETAGQRRAEGECAGRDQCGAPSGRGERFGRCSAHHALEFRQARAAVGAAAQLPLQGRQALAVAALAVFERAGDGGLAHAKAAADLAALAGDMFGIKDPEHDVIRDALDILRGGGWSDSFDLPIQEPLFDVGVIW